MFLCWPTPSAEHGVVNGDLPADNNSYDRVDTDRLATLRREICGTTEHPETPLERTILVELRDDYM